MAFFNTSAPPPLHVLGGPKQTIDLKILKRHQPNNESLRGQFRISKSTGSSLKGVRDVLRLDKAGQDPGAWASPKSSNLRARQPHLSPDEPDSTQPKYGYTHDAAGDHPRPPVPEPQSTRPKPSESPSRTLPGKPYSSFPSKYASPPTFRYQDAKYLWYDDRNHSPMTKHDQMAGMRPGQMMPAQLPARRPNGPQQTRQIPQNRMAQQSMQQPQQSQQKSQQQRSRGPLKIPNDLPTRGQPMNGLAMTNEQITSMDKIAFPSGIINSQNNAVLQLLKSVKTWGQLKQWTTSQKQDQDRIMLQKLLTLQRIHFIQLVAPNRSAMPAKAAQQNTAGNTSANAQGNVQMAAQAARVGQGVPLASNSGPPPMQQQKSQQGNQSTRPPPVQTGLPDRWQPSLQEIQWARISLPQHAQAWTDEMVRQFLIRAREHKMKEFQTMRTMRTIRTMSPVTTRVYDPRTQIFRSKKSLNSRPGYPGTDPFVTGIHPAPNIPDLHKLAPVGLNSLHRVDPSNPTPSLAFLGSKDTDHKLRSVITSHPLR